MTKRSRGPKATPRDRTTGLKLIMGIENGMKKDQGLLLYDEQFYITAILGFGLSEFIEMMYILTTN